MTIKPFASFGEAKSHPHSAMKGKLYIVDHVM